MGDRTCNSILVVEDDPDIRGVMLETLQEKGYCIQGAAHGREALEVLEHLESPILILLDLRMPVMDGAEFIRALGERKNQTHVVVMTATTRPEESPVAKVADDILKKPFNLDQLFGIIEKYCGPSGSPEPVKPPVYHEGHSLTL